MKEYFNVWLRANDDRTIVTVTDTRNGEEYTFVGAMAAGLVEGFELAANTPKFGMGLVTKSGHVVLGYPLQ